MSPRRVTLLSDFGTADGYAAVMAGVVAAAAPSARIEHASHDIPPGDLLTAALTLSRYAFLYPEDTVHLVVVDPGVGTGRRALAARVGGRFFVAPDNGVLSRVLERGEGEVVALEHDQAKQAGAPPGETPTSATFHGRDIFAPAAARLARGETLDALGSEISDPVHLELPAPGRTADAVVGEVIQVDRYGNLITNIPASWLRELETATVRVSTRAVGPLARTYADVEPGELVALEGSIGMLEVSLRNGSAAELLGLGRGAPVRVA